MKKVCMFLFIGVFLALMTALPCVADEGETSKVKFSINVGGMFAQISQGYDFSFDFDSRAEEASWSEAVANIGGKFGFDIGASIFPMPQLEIYASYGTYGGTALGDYTLKLPHWVYEDSHLTSTIAEVENEFKATVVNIGLAFHPAVTGKIQPYFGAGLSSVTVKMDLLDEVSIDDALMETEYFRWWDLWDSSWWLEYDETIAITGVGFTEESETAWGFHAKVGVSIQLAKNISIFVEGRYLSAKVEFERPDITFKSDGTYDYTYDYWDYYWDEGGIYEDETVTWTGEDEIEVDEQMEIKVGGIQGIVGIKLSF